MAISKNEALKLVKSFLIYASKRHKILSAYLFGSYAKGIQKDYSDIDLAIIIPARNKKLYAESRDIFHEAQEFNSLIEVVCFKEEEFKKDKVAIAQQIKKQGIKIKFE